jgi:spore coat polysaccharide biosynthesis protein SpsF
VVRITSDCPLIDPDLVDDVVGAFQRLLPDVDYVSNTLAPRSYPRGLDAEVFHVETLACAWRDDDNPAWREHVTPYLYRHPERFCLHRVGGEEDHSSLRWTVDTPEDFELVRRIYAHFGGNRFTWRQALALVEAQPELRSLNAAIVQKTLT